LNLSGPLAASVAWWPLPPSALSREKGELEHEGRPGYALSCVKSHISPQSESYSTYKMSLPPCGELLAIKSCRVFTYLTKPLNFSTWRTFPLRRSLSLILPRKRLGSESDFA